VKTLFIIHDMNSRKGVQKNLSKRQFKSHLEEKIVFSEIDKCRKKYPISILSRALFWAQEIEDLTVSI